MATRQPRPQDAKLTEEKLDEAFGRPDVVAAKDLPKPVGGATAETGQKLLKMIDEREKAKSTLWEALAYVQANLPTVPKNKTAKVKTKSGVEYSYKYADLPDVNSAVLPLLTSVGLVLPFFPNTKVIDGTLRTVLEYELIHTATGKSRNGEVLLPDRVDPQEVGSHITYWRRYIIQCITGLTADEDEDGTAAKQAAAPAERATAASRAPLPGDHVAGILSILTPEAKAPLSEIERAWSVVVKYGAEHQPSGVEANDERLTWYHTFCWAMKRRIGSLQTAEEARELYAQAKTVTLPFEGWTGEALIARGKELAAKEAEAEAARKAIEEEAAQTAGKFQENNFHADLYRFIWSGAVEPGEAFGAIDGAAERGEIGVAEQDALTAMVGNRPPVWDIEETTEVATTFWQWQAENAVNEEMLDEVREALNANGLGNLGKMLDNTQARIVSAAIAVKRSQLKGVRP